MNWIAAGYDDNYKLLVSCEGCTRKHIKCERVVPCKSCVGAGITCKMSTVEMERRATRVMGAVSSGSFQFVNLCMYELHQQGVLYGYGNLMKRVDLDNCRRRLEMFTDSGIEIECSSKIPAVLMDLVRSGKYGRLEYMTSGHYSFIANEDWVKEFMSFDDLCAMSKKLKVMPKLVETLNLGDYTVAHRMWIESVMKPYMPIEWSGKFMSRIQGRIVDGVDILMISAVIGKGTIVTATVVRLD